MTIHFPLYRQPRPGLIVFTCLFSLLLSCLPAHRAAAADPVIRYVAPSGTGDCSTWTSACSLQNALSAAQPGDEIWVAAGTYKPTDGTDRSISFILKSGVAVYGGFKGSETSREERSWQDNPTILSGDIGAANNPSDNSYHVIYAKGVSNGVLDGFTITDGNADSSRDPYGGGLYMLNDVSDGSLTLANLKFSNNIASKYAGALIINRSIVTITNSTFQSNSADDDGGAIFISSLGGSITSSLQLSRVNFFRNTSGGWGGAIKTSTSIVSITSSIFSENSANDGGAYFGSMDVKTTMSQVIFTANHTSGAGGAISTQGSSPILDRMIFLNNQSHNNGGAVSDQGTGAIITNSIFYGNHSDRYGGAITFSSYSNKSANLLNDTFSHNTASMGGGGIAYESICPSIRNSIIWKNDAPEDPEVEEGWNHSCSGTGNIHSSIVRGMANDPVNKVYGDLDPAFVSEDPANPDLHLTPGSPAIDLGSNADLLPDLLTDLDGNPRILGSTVDLGAYEQLKFNHPPVLSSTRFNLPEMEEDSATNNGSLVSDLLGNTVTDEDGEVPGLAVTGIDTSAGSWQYSIDNGASWRSMSGASSNNATLLGPGTRLRFAPDANWNGTLNDGLSFRAWDQSDGKPSGATGVNTTFNSPYSPYSSQEASFSITVTPVNDPPVNTTPPTISGIPTPNHVLTADPGVWNDSADTSSATFTYHYQWQRASSADGPWEGISGESVQTYSLTENDLDTYLRILVTVDDSGVGMPPSMSASAFSAPMQVLLNAYPPIARDDTPSAFDEDSGPQEIDVLANDSDADGDALVITAVTQGSQGTVEFTESRVTYTPALNASGDDSFTYTISDGKGHTASAVVYVTITERNDEPTISDITDISTDINVIKTIRFTIGDVETPASSLRLSASTSNPTLVPISNIHFDGSGADRTVTVTPAQGQSGEVTITILVTDAGGLSGSDSFVLTVNSPYPLFLPQVFNR